jgi:hypothetical protein
MFFRGEEINMEKLDDKCSERVGDGRSSSSSSSSNGREDGGDKEERGELEKHDVVHGDLCWRCSKKKRIDKNRTGVSIR